MHVLLLHLTKITKIKSAYYTEISKKKLHMICGNMQQKYLLLLCL